MAFRHARWALLAAVALGLPGCTSIFRTVFHSKPKPVMVRAAPAPAANPLTNAGRTYLAAGNTGLAIEAFQHAIGTGEAAAPALNGLAVSYARIGRFDTARKLFEQAIALAPDNQQYAANMARLLRSPELALRRDADIAAELAPAQVQAATPALAAAPVRGQLEQVSANEFRIVTMPAASAGASPKAPARSAAMTVRAPQGPAARPARTQPPAKLAPGRATAAPAISTATTIKNPFVASSAKGPAQIIIEVENRTPTPSPAPEAESAPEPVKG